jgi:hypothetical protein
MILTIATTRAVKCKTPSTYSARKDMDAMLSDALDANQLQKKNSGISSFQ